jgi:hypothetical protein
MAQGFADKKTCCEDDGTMSNSFRGRAGGVAMAMYKLAMARLPKDTKMSNADEEKVEAEATPAEPEAEKKVEETPAEASKEEPKASVVDVQAAIDAAVAAERGKYEALAKKQAEVEAKLASEVEARELKEVTDEVQNSLKFLPGIDASFGSAIRAMRKTSPEAAKRIEQVLSGANALLTNAKDVQMAPVGFAQTESLTPRETVDKLASEKVSNKLAASMEVARVMVYEERPDLVRAQRGEG